jgi:hypothetical protein
MSRGRQLKTKKQDWYWQAKMETRGKLQSELEMHKQKPLTESAREYIGKWLDKIDPLEAGAVIGLSMLIKPFVKMGSDIVSSASGGVVGLLFTNLPAQIGQFLAQKEIDVAKSTGKTKSDITLPGSSPLDGIQVEVTCWLISLGIAYYVIKNGIPFSNIASLVKMFGL